MKRSTAPCFPLVTPPLLPTSVTNRAFRVYLDVVDAQRVALQAERQETQLRGQRAISTILLAKALGGGWEREATQIAKSK